jgi:hypothetical protein
MNENFVRAGRGLLSSWSPRFGFTANERAHKKLPRDYRIY